MQQQRKSRILVVTPQQFEQYKRDAMRHFDGEYNPKSSLPNGRNWFDGFTHQFVDHRLRLIIGKREKESDVCSITSTLMLLRPDMVPGVCGDASETFLLALMSFAFETKAFGFTPPQPPRVGIVPSVSFEETASNLLAVHNAITIAGNARYLFIEGMNQLVTSMRSGAPFEIAQSDSIVQDAVRTLRSYGPVADIVPLIADRE
jgi:hypothetical protein